MGNALAPGANRRNEASAFVDQRNRIIFEESKREDVLDSLQVRRSGAGATAVACLTRNMQALERLIHVRGGLKKRDKYGFTALHWTALSGFVEGARFLLSHNPKPDIDAVSFEGYTPLHVAAFLGGDAGYQIGQALLEAGAKVDSLTKRGVSPLGLAASGGISCLQILKLLIESKGSLELRSFGNQQRTPLELALMSHDDEDIIEALLKAGAQHSSPNTAGDKLTPLHICTRKGRLLSMKRLLEAGANPNSVSEQGFTPIMGIFLNYSNGRLDSFNLSGLSNEAKRSMIQLLSNAGANVNAIVPGKDVNILHCAAFSSNEENILIDILNLPKFDPTFGINKKLGRPENTLLHICARMGWAEASRRLLQHGANPVQPNKEGFSAFHLAIIKMHENVVRAFLEWGCSPYQECPDIFPSIQYWRRRRQARAAALFMNGPIDIENAGSMIEQLHARERMISAVDLAVSTVQDIDVVETLLEFGAKPSEDAINVAAKAFPAMSIIVKRPTWTPEIHRRLPPAFKYGARAFMLSMNRRGIDLPLNVIAEILRFAAFPVNNWISMNSRFPWLEKTFSRKPKLADRPDLLEESESENINNGALPMGVVEFFPEIMNTVLNLVHRELQNRDGRDIRRDIPNNPTILEPPGALDQIDEIGNGIGGEVIVVHRGMGMEDWNNNQAQQQDGNQQNRGEQNEDENPRGLLQALMGVLGNRHRGNRGQANNDLVNMNDNVLFGGNNIEDIIHEGEEQVGRNDGGENGVHMMEFHFHLPIGMVMDGMQGDRNEGNEMQQENNMPPSPPPETIDANQTPERPGTQSTRSPFVNGGVAETSAAQLSHDGQGRNALLESNEDINSKSGNDSGTMDESEVGPSNERRSFKRKHSARPDYEKNPKRHRR